MQHAHVDAALPGFTERLIHLAVTQRWPVLILVTHTKAELAPTLMTSERSFAGVLAHAREGLTSDPGPAAGLPGGYLTNESFAEIDLRPIADLSTALREELPGLISVQSAAILEHIGGNPPVSSSRSLRSFVKMRITSRTSIFAGRLPRWVSTKF